MTLPQARIKYISGLQVQDESVSWCHSEVTAKPRSRAAVSHPAPGHQEQTKALLVSLTLQFFSHLSAGMVNELSMGVRLLSCVTAAALCA